MSSFSQNCIGNTAHAMQKSHIGAANKVTHDIQAHTAICNADEKAEQPGWIRGSTYQGPACHVQNQAGQGIYRSQRCPEEGEVGLIRVINDQASMRTPAPKSQKHGSMASITKDGMHTLGIMKQFAIMDGLLWPHAHSRTDRGPQRRINLHLWDLGRWDNP